MAGRCNITAVSYGLQAGIQAFTYVMFFMTDSAVSYLDQSSGCVLGMVTSFPPQRIGVHQTGSTPGVTLTNGNNNIYIGNQGGGDESQTIRVGTTQTRTFMAGINTAGVSGTAVVVDANGQLGITLPSVRYKRDIAPMRTCSSSSP